MAHETHTRRRRSVVVEVKVRSLCGSINSSMLLTQCGKRRKHENGGATAPRKIVLERNAEGVRMEAL